MTGMVMRGSDVPASLADQMTLARALASSGILPNHLRDKPENILAIMYAAQSIDVPVWQAMSAMQVISGKVGMSADLHRALILRAGHVFRVEQSTAESATVLGIRRDDPERWEHRATFTMTEAKLAGLTGGSWKTYPKAMLVARATTLLARQAFSDVIAGMAYTPEELGAEVDEDGRIVEVGTAVVVATPEFTTEPETVDAEIVPEPTRADAIAPVHVASGEPPLVDTARRFDLDDWNTRLDLAVTDDEFALLAAELQVAKAVGDIDDLTFDGCSEMGKARKRGIKAGEI